MKKKAKVLAFLLSVIMIVPMFKFTASAAITAEGGTADEIAASISSVYSEALRISGRSSFDGYCGAYVRCQMIALGIISSSTTGMGNGKDQFDYWKSKSTTDCGFSVVSYPASSYSISDVLNTVSSNGTKNAYNILLGFEWSNYGDGKTYGHVMFIRAIIGGTVYYTESSHWNINGGIDEGHLITCSISKLAQRYDSTNYTFDGGVHFYKGHKHSYTSSVTTKPTCTKAGVRTYTCSCGASYTETMPTTGHTLVTDKGTSATCTEAGLSEGSHCSVCKAVIKAQEAIPVLGHDLEATVSGTNITYKCANCSYGYSENLSGGKWSAWIKTKLTGISGSNVETKVQYRKATKDVKTSSASSMPGYEIIGSEWVESGTGSVSYVASFPSGFDTSSSIYKQYNVAAPQNSETATSKRVVNSTATIGYLYWHWVCDSQVSSGKCYADRQYGEYNGEYLSKYGQKATHFEYTVTSTPMTYAGEAYGFKDTTVDLPKNSTKYGYYLYWWVGDGTCKTNKNIEIKQASYTDYTKQNTFAKYSDFSSWQDTPITADENTQVETRTVYRYKLGDESHNYVICKDGTNHWYECTACHDKKDYSAHVYDNACDTTCNVCGATRSVTHSYKTTWSSDGTNHWHECSVCGVKKDTGSHSFVGNKCSVCGYATSYDLSPELSSARGSAGDTVKLTLSIDKNTLTKSGAISFELPSGFTIVDGEWKYSGPSKNDSGSSAVNILSFTASSGRGAFTYDSSSYYINGSVFELTVKIPDNCADGEYSVTGALQIVTPQKTALSIENSVATISVSKYIAGDLDVNGLVDADDAIYLLYHCFFADEYPVNQPCDFTKDGTVDADDAIYLLYHCFFADEYPLN